MKLYATIGRLAYPLLLPLMRPVLRRTERAYILIEHEGKYLFVKNWLARDNWRLPGGGIQSGEHPKDAAIREVEEEIGIALQPHDLSEIMDGVMKADGLEFPFHVYTVTLQAKPILHISSWEVIDFQWSTTPPAPLLDDLRELF